MRLNYRAIVKILGILTLIEGLFMMPALVVAMYFEEWKCASTLLTTSLICTSIGFVILTQLKLQKINLRAREGYLIAFVSWIYCSLLGAIPLYTCGEGFSLISCYFEAVAGFSTTGCTVLDINSVPQSIIFWRSICSWLGGMGILVLLISIFPLWGINNKAISSAEAPGTNTRNTEANSTETGKFLYETYLILSAIEFILLVIGPMDWYNAALTTFNSISTTGLLIQDQASWMYQLDYVKYIVLIFTILSSINFLTYFYLYKKRVKEAISNVEVRVYLLTIAIVTVILGLSLRITDTYSTLWQAFRDALFQVVSFISTSGYFVSDYSTWPTFCVTLLILLLFVGGCSSSTSGSLKIIRITILFKMIKRGILKQIHPNIVKAVMLDDKTPVTAKSASAVTMHTLLYFVVLALGTLLLSFNNFDMETTFTTALGIFSNTGISLGLPGNSGYYGMFNEFSQFVMTGLMIAGRLEMYSVVILLLKNFWTPNKTTTL